MSVIDDYLKNLPSDQKQNLEHIRSLAKGLVPEAEETIGYGMPVLKYKGKYLLGFAPFKDHMSIFPGAEAVELMSAKLTGFKTSKGTVQFTVKRPIPDQLLTEIIVICKNRIS
ncbi:MAG: DUF1801 domain-containing protein [Candidatus Saccharimonadales bacterium]